MLWRARKPGITDGTVLSLAQAREWLKITATWWQQLSFQELLQILYSVMACADGSNLTKLGVYYLIFRVVPWASTVPWWHTTGLAVLGARDLPLLCYVTCQLLLLHPSDLGFTPCGRRNLERCEVYCAPADERCDVTSAMYDLMQCVHFPINDFLC